MHTCWGLGPCYRRPARHHPGAKGKWWGVQAPLANLWAFWWSLCSISSASASPTRAAAASTPAWRIPPPRAFRRRQASSMKSLGPPTRAPTGAPRPWRKRGGLPTCPWCASLFSGLGRGQEGCGGADTVALLGEGVRGPRVSSCLPRSPRTQLSLLRWGPPPSCSFPTLEKQRDTESQCSMMRAGGTPRATAAFINRAPSRWTRTPWLWASKCTCGQDSGGIRGAALGGGWVSKRSLESHWACLLEEAQGVCMVGDQLGHLEPEQSLWVWAQAVLCDRGSMIRALSPVYGGLTVGQATNTLSCLSSATAPLEGSPQPCFPGE